MKRYLFFIIILLTVSSITFAQNDCMQLPLKRLKSSDGKIISPVSTTSAATTSKAPLWQEDEPPILMGVNNSAVTLDQSQYAVGEIPYRSDVVNGALAYTIPIQVAQAGKGLQPNISIHYNSMSGNGVAGYGWSTSGASVITIVHSDYYFDGIGAPPEKRDKSSAYALDGMRLIKTSQDKERIFYESETGNIKVINYAPSGKYYFEVLYPEGKTGIFGNPTHKTAQILYPLTKLTDKFSNYIEYSYLKKSNEENYFLSEIKYGSQNSLLGYITFEYKSRTDYHTVYMGSRGLKVNYLLDKVKSYYGYSLLLAEYSLEYTFNKVNLLTTINCSYEGKALRPLVFQYGSGRGESTILMHGYLCFFSNFFRTDTETDMVFSKIKYDPLNNNEGLIVYPRFSTYGNLMEFGALPGNAGGGIIFGSTYYTTQEILVYKELPASLPSYNIAPERIMAGRGFQKMVAADIDGTGKEKLIKVNYYEKNFLPQAELTFYDSDMKSFTNTYKFSETFTHITVENYLPRSFLFGDFTGAGKTQMLTFHGNKTPLGDEYSKESKVSIFNLAPYVTQPFFETTISGVDLFEDFTFVADMNGNGRYELCVINGDKTDVYALIGNKFEKIISTDYKLKTSNLEGRDIVLGDINKDGKTDILASPIKGSGSPSEWLQFISTGEQINYSLLTLPTGYKESDDFFLYDVDNEGYPDLVVRNSGQLSVYGNQYGDFTNKLAASISVNENSYLIPGNITKSTTNRGSEIIHINNWEATSIKLDRNEGVERLLTKVTDSYGIRSEYTYSLFAEKRGTTTTQVSYPYQKFIMNAPVITQLRTITDNQNTTFLTYNYYDAVVNRVRGNFVGFIKTSITDHIRQQTVTDYYDPTKLGALVKTESPRHVTETSYRLTIATNKKALLTPTNRKDTDLLTGQNISTSFLYDEYGNMISEIINSSDAPKKITTREYYNNTLNSNYVIGILTSQTSYTERGNKKSVIETDIYTLNSKNLPVKHEKWFENTAISPEPGSHTTGYDTGYAVSNEHLRKKRALLEENVYDNYGNLVKFTPLPFDADTARITTYLYDKFGRLTRETSPIAGLYISSMYNNRGLVSQTTNHKNQKIYYEHDAFGNVIKTTYPDGTVETSSIRWSEEAEPGLYCITTTATGQPTVMTWFDELGRGVRTSTQRFNGEWMKNDKEYDAKGLLVRESLPYTGATPVKWNSYVYDEFGRPIEIRYANGNRETHTYEGSTVISVKDNVRVSVTFNSLENPVSVTDVTGTITYTYGLDGQIEEITTSEGVKTKFKYDLFGRQISLHDPSAGTITWHYDAAGNMAQEVAASGKMVRYRYDRYNRVIRKDVDGMPSVHYLYNGENQLVEEGNSNQTTYYTYDRYGRVTEQKEEVAGNRWIRKKHTYTDGILTSTTYTSRTGNLGTENYIYTNGYLTEILLNRDTPVWKLVAENEMGIPIEVVTGPLARTYGYDEFGTPMSRMVKNGSQTIQDFQYSFNPETRNLEHRTDQVHDKKEVFGYDDLNRLTHFGDQTISYDNQGNILFKSAIGAYSYTADNPYGVNSIRNMQYAIPENTQQITYNAMKQPATIAENNFSATFVYGNDNQRIKMVLAEDRIPYLTRYYLFNYEVDETETGVTERLYISGDAYTSPIVLIKENGKTEINYICRDYLGSITHLTDVEGVVKQELSYDAWGRLRNAATHEVYASGEEPDLLLGRGYTGHEHLLPFGLINMNARLYDPVLARFLSPDPFVSSPLFSQAFNRYSYALNNPLRYTDPDGELPFMIPIMGFAIGYLSYGLTTGNWGLKAVYSGLIGAVTSTFGAAIMGGATSFQNLFHSLSQLTTVQNLQYIEHMAINMALANVLEPVSVEIGKFSVSISPVVMLTSSAMGGGFRLGGGLTVSYRHNEGWTFKAGIDAYSTQGTSFGLGTIYGGAFYDKGEKGFYFVANRYMREYQQASGIVGLRKGKYSINFEDDIFGLFQILKVKDRYRTAALEFGVGNMFIGTQVFTNDPTPKDIDHTFKNNKNGQHVNGYQLSSALYMSYKTKNHVFRFGNDSKLGGFLGQNIWHRTLFFSADFKPHEKDKDNEIHFFQFGTRQF